ncbi:expressed unknown protein [Seminavis robusta]|uniref:J domain-containing protein n=1 Tax=Seminavis robusta TaxID=568900 RepID=A0A9N8H7G6_9STRA|nr:expressed unknown protein [Seminavis robusta]|eukprot:Sro68_g037850.2  (391) ;mRNA; r:3854-5026
MEARFGRIILQQVDKALQEEPSRDALFWLLQIVDPSLDKEGFCNERKRASTFRQLKLLIHPDKNNDDKQHATKRFQDVQTFFDQCTGTGLHKQRTRRKKQHTNMNLPSYFHVNGKWAFLASHALGINGPPHVFWDCRVSGQELELTMAYKCINCRGTIAHGKTTEVTYNYHHVVEASAKTAKELFEDFGGSKPLGSVNEIKEEIMARGPVVSTSFCYSQPFFEASAHATDFQNGLVGSNHALLIVGWQQTACGEVWLVRSKNGATDIPIAIGQYSLEEDVIAPVSDLSNRPWQEPKKAFDVPRLPAEWYSWTYIQMYCDDNELQHLFKALGTSVISSVNKKVPFVIRESEKKARSRWAYLTDLEWIEAGNNWKVKANFFDDERTKGNGWT